MTDMGRPDPGDVDWRTVAQVAEKLQESLAGLDDTAVGAAPGELARSRGGLRTLGELAGRLAERAEGAR